MDINISDWEKSGEGSTATTYNNKTDKSILLKLFKHGYSKEVAENEYNNTKAVMNLGINIPKIYEVVEVGGCYGLIYERIVNKISVARLCSDDLSKMKYYAEYFANESKKLHSVICTDKNIVSAYDRFVDEISQRKGLDKKVKDGLIKITEELEETNTCLHGDLNPCNLIISDGKPYWIDIGDFAYGNPMYDLGSACILLFTNPSDSISKQVFHMNRVQCKEFWYEFTKYYMGNVQDDELEKFRDRCRRYMYLFNNFLVDNSKIPLIFHFIYNIALKNMFKKRVKEQ